jgi:hypothetical protein
MFLSGESNIQVGSGGVFTLDYDELAMVAGNKDSYFSQKQVIKEVIISYKESSTVLTRPQMKSLSYKDGATSSQINFSLKANPGQWEISEVIIKDFDGGDLILGSKDIPSHNSYSLTLIELI